MCAPYAVTFVLTIPSAVFVFDEDLATWRELLSMLLFPPSNLRNSKGRAVVESGDVGLHPAILSPNLGLLHW